MYGVLTGSRFTVHYTYLCTPLKKGFSSNKRTKFLRVYHVFADIVIISFECIKNSSNCILNDQWIVAHNPKTL